LERAKNRPVYKLDEDSITVGQMIEYVRQRLMLEERPLRLRQLLRNVHTRQGLVCVFLAILELIRLQAVLARQDTVFGDIVLKKHTNFDHVLGDSAGFKDDWK
jgi:segregation and condensation protein A